MNYDKLNVLKQDELNAIQQKLELKTAEYQLEKEKILKKY